MSVLVMFVQIASLVAESHTHSPFGLNKFAAILIYFSGIKTRASEKVEYMYFAKLSLLSL